MENTGYTSLEMESLKNKMIEKTNSVSNKESLKDKIHEIHNYLRNNGAGYGMNALKVFNIIYGLKKIEENELLDKVNLKKPDCEFSYLLKLANDNQDERLAELIFGNVLQSIYESELKDLLFYEIPKNIRGSVLVFLIKEINKITIIEKTCNVLLSGKIYEYFIGRDESAISELGAYFTDRHIVDYILSKLDPKLNTDGTISSMIDMFGGSGGFTTGYINYLNDKYPKMINWETEINKIYHFDMNEDVIKSAGLEFFCLTGVFPNMENLRYKNSFTDEFSNEKYKYPLTNPPYGGDKKKKNEAQIKIEKVKEYIKNELPTITDDTLKIRRQRQLKAIETQEKQEKKESDKAKVSVSMCSARIQRFARNHKLKGTDKESCSLMLLMDILEVGGTAIGVLKEGVLFNKTYKDLRKCLIENFNVREIISVPQDQFENTKTKTSIVIFDNIEEKTSEVIFRDLIIERFEEDKFAEFMGDIVVIENKGDIVGFKETLISQATKDEILANQICSLNGKDYNKKELQVGEGYELVKLGDIAKLENGKQLDKKKIVNGIYPVYGGGISPIGFHNDYNNENCTIVAGTGNCGLVQFNASKFWASQCFTIKSQNDLINKYIFIICKSLESVFKEVQVGSVQKFIRASQFKDLLIPIPKSQEKIQEWVDKIYKPYNEKNEKQSQIIELEKFIQNRIKEISDIEECDEVELGSVCEIKYGKRITEKKNKGSMYTAYGGGNIMTYKVDEFNRSGVTYKISRDGLSQHNCVTKIYGNIFLNDTALTLHSTTSKITDQYIGELMLINKDYIYKHCSHGSAQLHIDIDRLMKLNIKIPKNKQLIQDLEPTFQQIETIQNEVKIADELYKQLIQELSKEAMPQQITETTTEHSD
jgi:type I restriction-modification system DNA methylase subunit